MDELLKNFEEKKAEIVFEWSDKETNAKGWLVINSLRGGAAAGGTRMRVGVDKEEVISLAKTMEIKFTVAGPAIGGGKSGINFDPKDPRKKEVLKRWYNAARPLLKTYYGTGGDMNVDEVEEVIPMCQDAGISFPLEGVINGHFKKDHDKIIERLKKGVPLIVSNDKYTPSKKIKYSIGDLITGYGVSESVKHFYQIYGGNLKGKKIIIQGWGNVASTSAFYLAQQGALIVGIIDKVGGLIKTNGFSFEEIKSLVNKKSSNYLEADNLISYEEINEKIWDIEVDIFIPAAASRLLNQNHLERMINSGLQLISSGANVPFADKEIFFGPISSKADKNISVLPDFISNCGMARAFSYLMNVENQINDTAIFKAVSETIENAILEIYTKTKEKTNISKTALTIALKKLQ